MAFHVPMTFAYGVVMLRDWIGVIIQNPTEIVPLANNIALTILIVIPSNVVIITARGGRRENVHQNNPIMRVPHMFFACGIQQVSLKNSNIENVDSRILHIIEKIICNHVFDPIQRRH